MKLKWIKIINFRGIEELEFDLYFFSSLIGPNNTGKSSILKAIEYFLNLTKPSEEDWRKASGVEEMVIEGKFCDLQDWERASPGVAGIVQGDEIYLRLKVNEPGGKPKYEAFIQKEEIDDWSDSIVELKKTWIAELLPTCDISKAADLKLSHKLEVLKQHIRERFPEKIRVLKGDWTSENLSIDSALKQAIPRAELIPAVRDASEDTKPQAKTSFGKLLNAVVLPAIQKTDEFTLLKDAVNNLSKKIKGEDGVVPPKEIEDFAQEISSRIAEIINVKAILDIEEPDTDKFLGTSTVLRLDDGVETSIAYQGHGAQRSLIFALIEAIAKQNSKLAVAAEDEARVRSNVILFEEPELFLHPHLMRRLKKSLLLMAEQHGWQVIISTHSPVLIEVAENPKSLLILSKDKISKKVSVCQLKVDPFDPDCKQSLRATLDFHPTVNEAFFADRVVLVEGDTELAILCHDNKPFQYFNISDAEYQQTSIISCGGKWTIPAIAIILNAFGIPYRIIHDMDAKGRQKEDLEQVAAIDPYSANNKIAEVATDKCVKIIEDTMEHVLWPNQTVSSKDKPFNAWKEIKRLIEAGELVKNQNLKDIFEFAFKW